MRLGGDRQRIYYVCTVTAIFSQSPLLHSFSVLSLFSSEAHLLTNSGGQSEHRDAQASHINIISLATNAHHSFFFFLLQYMIYFLLCFKEALTIPKLQLHFYLYAVQIKINLNSQLPWLSIGYVWFCSLSHPQYFPWEVKCITNTPAKTVLGSSCLDRMPFRSF